MIAQTIAMECPSRVKSLTSIMFTTGDLSVGQPDFSFLSGLGQPPWNDREACIRWRLQSLKAINSTTHPFDEVAAGKIAGLSWDHDSLAMIRQAIAVLKSGDRTALLCKLQMPTLVIHGKEDRMIDLIGGKATAEAVPNAKLILFVGMGHGFPKALWTELAKVIGEHVQQEETKNS